MIVIKAQISKHTIDTVSRMTFDLDFMRRTSLVLDVAREILELDHGYDNDDCSQNE